MTLTFNPRRTMVKVKSQYFQPKEWKQTDVQTDKHTNTTDRITFPTRERRHVLKSAMATSGSEHYSGGTELPKIVIILVLQQPVGLQSSTPLFPWPRHCFWRPQLIKWHLYNVSWVSFQYDPAKCEGAKSTISPSSSHYNAFVNNEVLCGWKAEWWCRWWRWTCAEQFGGWSWSMGQRCRVCTVVSWIRRRTRKHLAFSLPRLRKRRRYSDSMVVKQGRIPAPGVKPPNATDSPRTWMTQPQNLTPINSFDRPISCFLHICIGIYNK